MTVQIADQRERIAPNTELCLSISSVETEEAERREQWHRHYKREMLIGPSV
jgi:hypothetical protein